MTGGDGLNALLSELRERFASDTDVREVEIYLASRGYDARQIDEIVALLSNEIGAAPARGVRSDRRRPRKRPARAAGPPTAANPASGASPGDAEAVAPMRVPAPYERARFSPDAWGHLLQLRAAGVTGVEFEQLIDRALMHIDGRIALDDLRTLMGESAGDEGGSWTVH